MLGTLFAQLFSELKEYLMRFNKLKITIFAFFSLLLGVISASEAQSQLEPIGEEVQMKFSDIFVAILKVKESSHM